MGTLIGMDLFAARPVERLRDIAAEIWVPMPNSSEATYGRSGDGRLWIRKVVTATDILSEAIGYLLCHELDLPAPSCAYYRASDDDDDEPEWLSGYVAAAVHWTPDRPQALANPGDLGGILAVDAVIGNFDRNPKNLLLVGNSADSLQIHAIDFANSWVGTPRDFAARQLTTPPIDNLVVGVPVDMIQDGALASASAMSKIDETVIRAIVDSGCDIARERERDTLTAALLARCAAAERVVNDYLQTIRRR